MDGDALSVSVKIDSHPKHVDFPIALQSSAKQLPHNATTMMMMMILFVAKPNHSWPGLTSRDL